MAAWLKVLSSHGCEISYFLNPGASIDDIKAVESSIGYEFTDDLKALYSWADGQQEYFADADRRIVHYEDGGADMIYDLDPSPGQYLCPLLGHYFFDSLALSIKSYAGWLQIADELTEEELNHSFITVRPGHAVDRAYFKKGWLPISSDGGGNSFAVDFDPPEGGTYGQIIVMGPDEDERRVIASSITELLIRASTCDSLNPEYSNNGRGTADIFMSFDMECWL